MTEENQELTIQTEAPPSSNALMFSPQSMGLMNDVAQVMAQGVSTVPKHLQGKPADCLAVVMQAAQWGMNPFPVCQKTHLVNGSLGYEAQLVNAVISSSNAIEGRFHYEYSESFKNDKDPEAWVKVGAKIRGEDSIQWGEKVYPSEVTIKNSPLWKTNPKQQCSYLALKYWSRLYTPAVIMGVYTPEELREVRVEKEVKGETIKDMKPQEPALDNFDEPEKKESTFQNVDEVLQDIAKASTLSELKLVSGYAKNVESQYLEMVRTAYSARGTEIKEELDSAEADPEDEGVDKFREEYNNTPAPE